MTEKNNTVLIVDDSSDDLKILLENLKQDYAVLAATSGKKALEFAAKEPRPDVILLDVMMPEMDGYETC
ncbi:MAG: response regulator, partial [Gammaproteobacteria bacterium]|nr:response regulator [Gammaproteobacteria bacterium]